MECLAILVGMVKTYFCVCIAEEILDSCEASGTKIGIKVARIGCDAVNNKCFSNRYTSSARSASSKNLEGE